MKSDLQRGHPLRWIGYLFLTGFIATAPAEPLDQTNERARIQQERAQVEWQFQQNEQNCFKRFVVTPCTDKAQRVRRDLLADLRRQENLLDEARRKQRAAERLLGIEEKARPGSHEILPPPSSEVRPTDLADSVEKVPPQDTPLPGSGNTTEAQSKRNRSEVEKSAQAARRVRAQRDKLAAQVRRRAGVDKRLNEKAHSSKPASASLPTPVSSASEPAAPSP